MLGFYSVISSGDSAGKGLTDIQGAFLSMFTLLLVGFCAYFLVVVVRWVVNTSAISCL